MIEFTRTFHPVGQGAFYSERFSFDSGIEFLSAYDCGTDLYEDRKSKSNSALKSLNKLLNQDLGPKNRTTKKHDLNLLFISHFDEDHVSGVPYLNPKVVVIPLLSKDEITLYELLNTLQITNVNIALLQNPKSIFGNGNTIVGVMPEIEEGYVGDMPTIDINEEGRITPNNSNQDPEYPQADVILPSGSVINLNNSGNFWQYIVFNPILSKLTAADFNNFKNGLNSIGINWETLADELKKGFDEIKIKELRNLYQKHIRENLNSTSLLVYSGPIDKVRNIDYYGHKINHSSQLCHFKRPYACCCHCDCCDFWYMQRDRIACMYFGDWRITQKAISKYYSVIPFGGDLIGTIQVPHHGSRHNCGQYALEYLDNHHLIKCVISHGEKNRHKHPSSSIISKLMILGGEIVLVTDNATSAFITQWSLSYKDNK